MSAGELETFTPKDGATIKGSIATYRERAEALEVSDAESYTRAGELLVAGKELLKAIGAYWEEDVAAANRLHKSLTGKRKADLELVSQVLEPLEARVLAFRREEERRRELEEAKLAEAQRQITEAVALETAAALETSGQVLEAAAVLEEVLTEPVAVAAALPALPQVAGLGFSKAVDFEVVAPHLVPRDLCMPDPAAIRQRIKATAGTVPIPGVRITRGESTRRRRA